MVLPIELLLLLLLTVRVSDTGGTTTIPIKCQLLVLLFSLPLVPLDSGIPTGNEREPWPLPGNKDGSGVLPGGEDDFRAPPGGSRALPGGKGESRALPGGRGGTIIIPIDIGPIVSVVASFTF